jgi:hypothetical protein
MLAPDTGALLNRIHDAHLRLFRSHQHDLGGHLRCRDDDLIADHGTARRARGEVMDARGHAGHRVPRGADSLERSAACARESEELGLVLPRELVDTREHRLQSLHGIAASVVDVEQQRARALQDDGLRSAAFERTRDGPRRCRVRAHGEQLDVAGSSWTRVHAVLLDRRAAHGDRLARRERARAHLDSGQRSSRSVHDAARERAARVEHDGADVHGPATATPSRTTGAKRESSATSTSRCPSGASSVNRPSTSVCAVGTGRLSQRFISP